LWVSDQRPFALQTSASLFKQILGGSGSTEWKKFPSCKI